MGEISFKSTGTSNDNKNSISTSLQQNTGVPRKTDSFLIQPPQINLPKGGGAIKSIDEKFLVNAVNGTASFSVPIPLSTARGFSPSMTLNYNSGSGNGIFGLGWSLSLSSVKRKTENELPQYIDDAESDTFVFSGAEDLVPEFKRNANGDLITDGEGKFIINQFPLSFAGVTYEVR